MSLTILRRKALSPSLGPVARAQARQRSALWLLCVALAAGVTGAQAEKADRSKPLNFTADNLRYDDVKQTNVLTGNVQISKGTMVMRAARVEVRQTPDGYQSALGLGSGKPAYFRQKREAVDEFIEGEAERVEYDGKTDLLRLSGGAVIRRFRGNVLADEVSGQVITYDNAAEVFTVDGTATGTPGGRVRGVLSPKPQPAAAPAPDPAASRNSP